MRFKVGNHLLHFEWQGFRNSKGAPSPRPPAAPMGVAICCKAKQFAWS